MDIAAQTARLWPAFQWRYLLLLPVGAAIVHLIVTFRAALDTRNSAYERLAQALPLNTMKLLPPLAPGQQPLPFLGADARYAICRFSSVKGPVEVRAFLPDRGWTLGISQPDGTTAYFAAGSTGRPTTIALSIVPGGNRFLGLSPQALGKPASATSQLTIPVREGLIVVRAPDRGAAYRQSDEVMLAKASCSAQQF